MIIGIRQSKIIKIISEIKDTYLKIINKLILY
jgi:hypothetical protein